MASLGIDGLVSGLDTTTLINTLMASEAVPQTILKNKATVGQTLVTALQGLNTKVADLATLAKKASAVDSLAVSTATSSSTSVTAATTAGAIPGQLDFTVRSTAQAKSGVTAAMTAWPDSPATLTFVGAGGKTTEVTAASSSLDDVVKAVNASADAGVRATKVASGKDASGATLYRLQLTSATSGAEGGFEVHRGTAAAVADGSAVNLLTQPGAAVVKEARDASVTLWAGTAAEQVVTSASNTFSDLLPGVSVTLAATAKADEAVTVTVARDTAAASKVASDLVTGLNGVLTLIAQRSASTTSTSATGTTSVTGGAFTGNSTTREVSQRLSSAMSAPIGGTSPSSIGISITKTGTFEFDDAKFQTALAADPAKVQSMLTELAGRVSTAASSASDKFDGTLTKVITGQQSLVKDLNDQVSVWDDRLSSRRAQLQKTYSALETALSSLQSQQSWLTSQLSSLSTSS
ncbi:flagellar hook-associated protein 2 [Frigoribacterium sp. PhB160]|uniref:flagellar filament capping protein FliD n=1 Tax=Frigoribacterium sp. PhB160 TaxID=2485192 RepID=UPI000F483393|nr:flagellar filament capping protein FliD [Frigoribacterium sp. PhB160]ROS58332.1 flagellar hook-associated protein 2 [Frigoribacterium sp. PhB160]